MRAIWLACLAAFSAVCSPAAGPVKVLFLTGDMDVQYHDWRLTTPFLRQALAAAGRFETRIIEQPAGITARTLTPYDVLVIHYNGPRWGEESERAVEEFVKSGKGMVSVHGVTYGPLMGTEMQPKGGFRRTGNEWKGFVEMLGVTWEPANIGHAPRHAFPVKFTDREHPIARGMEAGFIANDELYHKMDHRPGNHVIATAYDDPALGGTGKDEPILWTVNYGKGRVFHSSLGHDLGAMYQPGFLATFARAVEWAATGEVTLPPRLDLHPAPKDPVRALVVTGGHGYNTSFYTVFDGWPDVTWTHVATPAEAYTAKMKERWDVVVLYDLRDDLNEEQRANLRGFIEAGKGVVSLHHSIADNPSWPWWREEAIGGHYMVKPMMGLPGSTFKEGVPLLARPAKGMANHPVVRGVGHLEAEDELYKGMWHSPRIRVLMESATPANDSPVVYLGPHPEWKVVYIQFGHGSHAHYHPGYRMLVHNAIVWAAGRGK
jgi:uncharacterized protein